MAFNGIDVRDFPVVGNPTLRNLLPNIERGFNAGLLPYKLAQEIHTQKLKDAFTAAQTESLNKIFDVGGLTGTGAERFGIELIGRQHGKDSDVYKDALRSYNTKIEQQESLIPYRQSLTDTANKRTATGFAKTQQEIADIEAGYMPGTGRNQQLAPDEQGSMLDEIKARKLKDITDSQVRAKVGYATNIDKTIDAINIKDLTNYSGIKGQGSLAKDALLSQVTKVPKYKAFQDNLVLAKTLAKQVRQFYGDSIQPQVLEELNTLTNPSTWLTSPEIAISKFNSFAKLLKSETQTYKDMLKGASGYNLKDNKPEKRKVIGYYTPDTYNKGEKAPIYEKDSAQSDPLGIR